MRKTGLKRFFALGLAVVIGATLLPDTIPALAQEETVIEEESADVISEDTETVENGLNIDAIESDSDSSVSGYVSDLKFITDNESNPTHLIASFKVLDPSKYYFMQVYRDGTLYRGLNPSNYNDVGDGLYTCDFNTFHQLIEDPGTYSFRFLVCDTYAISPDAPLTTESSNSVTLETKNKLPDLTNVVWNNETGMLSWDYASEECRPYYVEIQIAVQMDPSEYVYNGSSLMYVDNTATSLNIYDALNAAGGWEGTLSQDTSFLFSMETGNIFKYFSQTQTWIPSSAGETEIIPDPTEPTFEYTDDDLQNGWWQEAELKSGKTVKVGMTFTNSLQYDGRKHVVKGTAKPSTTVNPDIEVEDFSVFLDGEKVPGISVSKYKYVNNQNAGSYSYYGYGDDEEPYSSEFSQMMQIIPTLKYDKSNAELKEILKEEKDLQTVLNSLMNPKKKMMTGLGSGGRYTYYVLSSTPIVAYIQPLTIGSDTKIYTQSEIKSNSALKTSGGFLVYNGKITPTFKKFTHKLAKNAEVKALSCNIGGLAYQFAYDLGNGTVKTKQVKLRTGKMTYKWDTIYGYDGIVLNGPYCTGTFDYIIDPAMSPGKDAKIYFNVKPHGYYDYYEDTGLEYELDIEYYDSNSNFIGEPIEFSRDQAVKKKEFKRFFPNEEYPTEE